MQRDPPDPSVSLRPYWLGLLVCLLLLAAYIAAVDLLNTETAERGSAPPWYAWIRYQPTRTQGQALLLLPPMILYAGWTAFAHWITAGRRKEWVVVLVSCLFVLALNSAVATMDGSVRAVWKPFYSGLEYTFDLPKIHDVGQFLHDYATLLPWLALHTRTHPPGAVLLLYFIAKLLGPGIPGLAWAAVAITASGPAPAYLLARRVAGAQTAAVVLALYAVTPGLVLFGATSMDGVFLPFILWAAYLLHRVILDRSIPVALAAGVVLFICFMLTYATVCMVGLLALLAVTRPKSLSFLAVSAVVVAGCFLTLYVTTGCNILACLHASRGSDHYVMRTFTLQFGRYLDISFDNLAAFLVGVGLGPLVLWTRALMRKASALNLAFLATILLFSFARLYTHETERVWMFLYPVAQIAPAQWIAGRANDAEKRQVLDWTMNLLFLQTWLSQLLLDTVW